MEKVDILNNSFNTPIVRLKEIEKIFDLKNELYAKIEINNPTGSIKDRACIEILNGYINDGIIKDNTTLIEATSGNMGISLSYYANKLNIPCIIVMPNSASKQRQEIIENNNAKVIRLDGGMNECNELVKKLLKENKNYVWFDQFNNTNSVKAHLKTAKEIDETINDLDYIFIAFGSAGTIGGIAAYYKTNNKPTKIIGIEPDESPLVKCGITRPHLIQGIAANFVPPLLNKDHIDDIELVKGEDAINMAKMIKEEEDLFVGISSGANVLATITYLKNHNIKNKKVLTLLVDKGDRYSW